MIMTYEELQKSKARVNDIINGAYEQYAELESAYILEHLPFPFKLYQVVEIVCEVTEEMRKHLSPEAAARKKNQLGNRFKVSGMLVRYEIGRNGELRPHFYGDKYYHSYAKIISIKEGKQHKENCTQCRLCEGGMCMRTGKAFFPVNEQSYICGMFRAKNRFML